MAAFKFDFKDTYVCDNKGTVYKVWQKLNKEYLVDMMKPFYTRDGYVEYVLTNKYGVKKHIQAHRTVHLTIPGRDEKIVHEYPILTEDVVTSASPHPTHIGRLDADFDGDKMSFTALLIS